jgi:hypothetical protein
MRTVALIVAKLKAGMCTRGRRRDDARACMHGASLVVHVRSRRGVQYCTARTLKHAASNLPPVQAPSMGLCRWHVQGCLPDQVAQICVECAGRSRRGGQVRRARHGGRGLLKPLMGGSGEGGTPAHGGGASIRLGRRVQLSVPHMGRGSLFRHGEREAQQWGKCSCRFLATSRYRKIE